MRSAGSCHLSVPWSPKFSTWSQARSTATRTSLKWLTCPHFQPVLMSLSLRLWMKNRRLRNSLSSSNRKRVLKNTSLRWVAIQITRIIAILKQMKSSLNWTALSNSRSWHGSLRQSTMTLKDSYQFHIMSPSRHLRSSLRLRWLSHRSSVANLLQQAMNLSSRRN